MAGVWEDMGQGKARTVTLPGWSHVVSEVFYGGKWHYVDLDVRAVFRRPDGTLASLAEARQDASLWQGRGPLFFPNDSLESARRIYQQTRLEPYHGFNQSGHTMDFVLRQGETLTRWWKPQGGRWHHCASYNKQDWLRRLIDQEPRGPKPNHRDFTIHNYGNGRFVYRPNLTEKSTDFVDGAYDSKNVRPGPRGLTLAGPGDGYAVFEVRTPYVIVPIVGNPDTTADDREASVLEIDAERATLQISLDNGLTWEDLPLASGEGGRLATCPTDNGLTSQGPSVEPRPIRLDLTRYAAGTYGYLLKIVLRGRPEEAVVRSLCLTTWVQVAPASLPSLRAGENRMEYRTGDHYGLKTRVQELRGQGGNPKELLKHLAQPPADYDPARKTERIRGQIVVKVPAPPRTRIAWFTAEGSFRTHFRQAARNTRNTIAYAAGTPERFVEIYRADVPADTEHWHCNAHCEVRLEKPAESVLVRYVGDPALNNFCVYAHVLDDGRRSAVPVRITHVWTEKGLRKSKSVALQQPGPYSVVAGSGPADESIEISVPSDGR
jgi:hypothetical protein